MAFRIAQALDVPLDDAFQYPVPSINQGDKHMESQDQKAGRSQTTGRFVDEIRKLRGRPDAERLVDELDKLKDRPDTKRIVNELDKLKGRSDTKQFVDELDNLKDQ